MKRIATVLIVCVLGLFGVSVIAFSASMSAADGATIFARCAPCHGADGAKAPLVLKGQGADAITKKLQGYVDGTYGGDKKERMGAVAKSLGIEERQAVAQYIGSL